MNVGERKGSKGGQIKNKSAGNQSAHRGGEEIAKKQ